MIDNENNVFKAVSDGLRKQTPQLFIIGTEITSMPPQFPAVTVVLTNNEINTRYAAFDHRENVVIEEYKIEVYSNLQGEYDRFMQAKFIARRICDIMDSIDYVRTFDRPVPNADATISRRVLRFRKRNLTEAI